MTTTTHEKRVFYRVFDARACHTLGHAHARVRRRARRDIRLVPPLRLRHVQRPPCRHPLKHNALAM
eukprot:6514143-Pyramimonas_sp.AAC.1